MYDLINVISLRKYYFVCGFFCNFVNVVELRLIKFICIIWFYLYVRVRVMDLYFMI